MSKVKSSSVCCKCQAVASKFCDSCDLHYCGTCCHYRHRQGSFLRHSIVNIELNISCNECNKKDAILRCNACELDYCSKCSQEIHQYGTMQCHIRDHQFDLYPLAPSPRGDDTDAIGSSLASAISGIQFENSDLNSQSWSAWEINNEEFPTGEQPNQWTGLLHIADTKVAEIIAHLNSPTAKQRNWNGLNFQGGGEKSIENFSFHGGGDPLWKKNNSTSVTGYLNDDNVNNTRTLDIRTLSLAELEELVGVLSSSRPTRQLVIRHVDGAFDRPFFELLSEELKNQTAWKKFHTELFDLGVLVVAFFDLRSAMSTKMKLDTMSRQTTSSGASPFSKLIVNFSVPFANTSKGVDDGKLLLTPVDPSITNSEVQMVLGQHGEVVDVSHYENFPDSRQVEYNDIRDSQNALRNLNGTIQWGNQLHVGFAPLSNEIDDKSCKAMRIIGGSPERLNKSTSSTFSTTSTTTSTTTKDDRSLHNLSPTPFSNLPGVFNVPHYGFGPGSHEIFCSFSTITEFPGQYHPPTYPQNLRPSHNGLGGYYSAYYNDFGTFDTWGGQGTGDSINGRPNQLGLGQNDKSRAVHPLNSTPNYHAQSFGPPVYSSTSGNMHTRAPSSRKKREPFKQGESRHCGRNDQGSGEYGLNIDNVVKGMDKRTTLMVRNIPNKYSQQMLLAEIKEKHMGKFDFFYLPIDFKNKCNMGYAFINFIDHRSILSFYEEFNDLKWRNFNSEKICAISYARLQGKAAMVARFQNSSLLEKDESYRPLVFCSSGVDQGNPEPFPMTKKSHAGKGNGENSGTEPVLIAN